MNMSLGISSAISVVASMDGRQRDTDAETKIQMRARRACTVLAVKLADLPIDCDADVQRLFQMPWKVRCMVQVICEIPYKASEWSVWALNAIFTKSYQAMHRFPPLS